MPPCVKGEKMTYLDVLGIHETDIQQCWRECEDALDAYVGSTNWTEDEFDEIVIENLESKPINWKYSPTEQICEAMLRAAKDIASRHGIELCYSNNGMDTKIWVKK